MPTMSDANFDGLYCLFKGEPGTRKSTQALSFPGPQYWFSWDRKMNGIHLPMRKWGIDPKTITFDDYDNWSKPKAKLEQFQLNCPYKTIVIDSIAVNEIEDYNAESSALNELIALTKDINNFHKVNVILIAHVVKAEYRDTTKNVTHISRQIVTAGKNVAAKIPAYCGEVYHFNIDKGMVEGGGGDYTLLTEHTGDDFARTALDLPSKVSFGDKPLYDTYIKPAIVKATAAYVPTN